MYIPLSFIEDSPRDSYARQLQASRNRDMHSLNGNPPKKNTRKVRTKKKKTTVQKKARRSKRDAQLRKQKDFILEEQKAGNVRAAALGPVIRGRGDYEMGTNIGSKIGGFLGGKLHQWLSTIFGRGDYEVFSHELPQSNSFVAKPDIPRFRNGHEGVDFADVTWFDEVPHTTNFSCRSYRVDMTDPSIFLWSNGITKCFQQWELIGMVVVYKNQSSELTTANALGNVCLSVRYDVDSLPPTSMEEALNSSFAVSAKPCEDMLLFVECARSQTPLWPLKTRRDGQTVTDEQFYTHCIIDFCSEGANTDYEAAGRLVTSFEARHYKKFIMRDRNLGTTAWDLATSDYSRPLMPLADSVQIKQPRVNQLGLSLDANFSKVVFPVTTRSDRYFLVWASVLVEATNGGIWAMNGHNMVNRNFFKDNTIQQISSLSSSTNTNAYASMLMGCYSVDDTKATPLDPPYVQITFNKAYAAANAGTLIVQEVSGLTATGLQHDAPRTCTRREFVSMLRLKNEGISGDFRAFPRGRIVDIVEAFKKEATIGLDKPAPRSQMVYEMSMSDAIFTLARLDWDPHEALDDYDEIKLPPRPPRRFLTRSQLNGANGEWTGSDDVKKVPVIRESTFIIPVNSGPPLPMTRYLDETQYSRHEGAYDPSCKYVLHAGHWYAPFGARVAEDHLIPMKEIPTTYRQAREIQCFFLTGKICTHRRYRCPGHRDFMRQMAHESAAPKCRPQINGANGEWTGSDDIMRECQGCDAAVHYHRVVRAASSGYLRRAQERERKESQPKYVACPQVDECKEPHYHPGDRSDYRNMYTSQGRAHDLGRQSSINMRNFRRVTLVAQQLAREQEAFLGVVDAAADLEGQHDEPIADPVDIDPWALPIEADNESVPTAQQQAADAELWEVPVEGGLAPQPADYSDSDAEEPNAAPPPPFQVYGRSHQDDEGPLQQLIQRMHARDLFNEERKEALPHDYYQINSFVPVRAEDGSLIGTVEQVLDWLDTHADFSNLREAQAYYEQLFTYRAYEEKTVYNTIFAEARFSRIAYNEVKEHHKLFVDDFERRCARANELAQQLSLELQFRFADIRIPNAPSPPREEITHVYSLNRDPPGTGSIRPGEATCVICASQYGHSMLFMPSCMHPVCAHCAENITRGAIYDCPVCRRAHQVHDAITHSHTNAAYDAWFAALDEQTSDNDHDEKKDTAPAPPVYDRFARLNIPARLRVIEVEPPPGSRSTTSLGYTPLPDAQIPVPQDEPVAHEPHLEAKSVDGRERKESSYREMVGGGPPDDPESDDSDDEDFDPYPHLNFPAPGANWESIRERINARRFPGRGYNLTHLPRGMGYHPAQDWQDEEAGGALVGVRHWVHSSLALAIISLRLRAPSVRLRDTLWTGHGAPPAPPIWQRVVGDLPLQAVTLYSTFDAHAERPFTERAWRWLKARRPFYHATVEHHPGDNPSTYVVGDNHVYESSTGLSFRFGFWSVTHLSPLTEAPGVTTVATALLASLYRSTYTGFIFPDLYQYLFSNANDRLVSLNARSAGLVENGKFSVRAGFSAAIKRCILEHPQYQTFLANGVQNLDDTALHYLQQRFLRDVRDLSGQAIPRGVDFRVGAPSAENWTSGAPTAVAASTLHAHSSSSISATAF